MEVNDQAVAEPAESAPGDESTAIVSALGRAVSQARASRKLSMRVVAAEAGISQPFLSQIENGRTLPSLLTLYRIAKALGVSPAELMPGEPEPEPITLVRRGEGRFVPVSEAANSSVGRLISSGLDHPTSVSEYVIRPGEDMGDWFESDGELTVYVVEGSISVTIESRGEWMLDRGDAITYPGALRNRWQVRGDEPATLVMVYTSARELTSRK